MNKIEPKTLWRRKEGMFTHAVYEILEVSKFDVFYTPRKTKKPVRCHMDKSDFLKVFEPLSADDVLEETGGIF